MDESCNFHQFRGRQLVQIANNGFQNCHPYGKVSRFWCDIKSCRCFFRVWSNGRASKPETGNLKPETCGSNGRASKRKAASGLLLRDHLKAAQGQQWVDLVDERGPLLAAALAATFGGEAGDELGVAPGGDDAGFPAAEDLLGQA